MEDGKYSCERQGEEKIDIIYMYIYQIYMICCCFHGTCGKVVFERNKIPISGLHILCESGGSPWRDSGLWSPEWKLLVSCINVRLDLWSVLLDLQTCLLLQRLIFPSGERSRMEFACRMSLRRTIPSRHQCMWDFKKVV